MSAGIIMADECYVRRKEYAYMRVYMIQNGTFMSVHDDWLTHHGVKGQKWGVRRYQNKDGSLTNTGKNRYAESPPPSDNRTKSSTKNETNSRHESVRRLANLVDEYNKNRKSISDEFARIKNEYEQTDDQKVHDKLDEQYRAASKKDMRLWNSTSKVDKELTKSIFESPDVKPAVEKARQKRKELDGLWDEYVGPDSDAYKQYAIKYGEYLKKSYPKWYTTEARVKKGVDQEWPYSDERWKASKDYQKASESKQKEYDAAVSNVGKVVVAGMAERSYDDWARNAARNYFDGHRVTSMFDEDY